MAKFDRAYYQRYYRNPVTRAVTPGEFARMAEFLAAYLRYLDIDVRRILDIGCGIGSLLRALGRRFPRARTSGVEPSEYLRERYRWEPGSVATYEARTPFDLVVCNDVLQYLDDRDATQAISNLASLSRGALYLGVLTAEDWAENCDRARTDPDVVLRKAAWYRRRLHRHFVEVGGGLFLKAELELPYWELERFPRRAVRESSA